MKILLLFCYVYTYLQIKSFANTNDNREKVILLLFGSFNPPTIMHFRIFGKYELYSFITFARYIFSYLNQTN